MNLRSYEIQENVLSEFESRFEDISFFDNLKIFYPYYMKDINDEKLITYGNNELTNIVKRLDRNDRRINIDSVLYQWNIFRKDV